MPIVLLVRVTNRSAPISGSIFDLRNRIGAVDPMRAASITARTILMPTAEVIFTCGEYIN